MRPGVPPGPRPVDWVLAIYNAVAGAAWLPALGISGSAGWIVSAHTLGVLLPMALGTIDRSSSRAVRILREAYPLLLLYPFFAEVGLLHQALGSVGHDGVVAAWDAALFPGAWHRTWAAAAPGAWMREAMHALYVSYYLLIAGPPLAAVLLRNGNAFRDISYRMMLTYTACYAVYLFFPVLGPGHADPLPPGATAQGFFPGLMHAAMASGDAPGTAFPSSHVAGAFTAAWLGARWFPRVVARTQLVLAVGVAAATVYTHNHYVLDAVAGFLFALLLQRLLAPAIEGAWGNAKAPGVDTPPAPARP